METAVLPIFLYSTDSVIFFLRLLDKESVITTNIPPYILRKYNVDGNIDQGDKDEPGRGPEYRIRSDEPEPFGYDRGEPEEFREWLNPNIKEHDIFSLDYIGD